ncbi:enolase-phosphatase e1 [Anaeramoeba flamelloides]|uniref:Enolase-phosphatase e1 n=1 Tax=Anaeramoeba flamelloides TaxID=1746091 RepID=A0ABQ8Y4T9_9EUKA|nr:enolase-phosphatase e1 [Anaeramoeba flamelloides]
MFNVKREKCHHCNKTVYAMEKLSCENKVFHKRCLRCKQCNKLLSTGNYKYIEGKFFCGPHFKQIFLSIGHYSAFSDEKKKPKKVEKKEEVKQEETKEEEVEKKEEVKQEEQKEEEEVQKEEEAKEEEQKEEEVKQEN